MPLNVKFRACLITFTLLVSSLSIFVMSPESVKADEFDDIDEFFLYLYGFHPFLTAGWYEYYGNESILIDGDVVFDLYFTTTLSTQTKYQDDLKVTIYSYDIESLLPIPKEIENGNTTITMVPEKFGETVQKFTVKLENVSYNLSEGEILIFTVEVIQSDKPIGNIIEKRYEKKLKARIEKVGELLNKSSNEDLKALGDTILMTLEMTEAQGITAEEISSLADSFSSSSFVYNSADYPSSVFLPIVDSDENLTLYFNSYNLGDDDLAFASYTELLEESPNGSALTWPTRLISLDPTEPIFNTEEWLLVWFPLWLDYIVRGAEPPMEEDENKITYYLTGENTLVLDEPVGDSPSKSTLSSDPTEWEGISFSRNKIINNVTADLYAYYPKVLFLRKITVEATLFDEDTNEAIATDQQQLDRTTILELLTGGPDSPTVFTFDDAVGKEIWNGHKLKLIVTSSGEPAIYPLRKTKLLCGSEGFPSSITFNLEETDNIKITNDLEDQIVIPSGSAKFTLDIYSNYTEDSLNIEVIPKDPEDLNDWDIEHPDTIQITADDTVTIDVYVNSTNNNISAYEFDDIDLFFNVSGKTGFDSQEAEVEVSEDAVEYNIEVEVPSDKEIKHGTSGTYTFKIKNANTGLWHDSYEIEASSEHDWVENVEDELEFVENGEEVEVKVTVSVPEDTETCYDVLTLKIISKESQEHDKEKIVTIKVITTVIGPNILEHIYNFFESVAENIGLDEILGDYAAAFLIFLVLFIIIIFLAPIIYFIRKKYVELICLERIKEIDPDEKAEFEITLRNPTKDKLTYEISAEEVNSSSERWEISLETENIEVESKQSQIIYLTVKPTDYVKQDDWAEAKIVAKPIDKKKKAEISTVTSIKDAKPELQIIGVFHWPNVFRKGDRITTSFRINNKGKVSASNITVVLYVNGEEKNKVEDITIPRGGYAEIEIPWVAVKGKNEVNIVVK